MERCFEYWHRGDDLDFALTEEQVQMRDSVRRMVEREIQPILKKNRRDVALPKSEMLKIFGHVAKYGLLAPRLPESAGGPVKTQARDLRGSIRLRAIEARVPHGCVQKFVHGTKSSARKNQFDAYKLVAFLHVAQQLNFPLGARSKVSMPTL